jgi:MFS family permease
VQNHLSQDAPLGISLRLTRFLSNNKPFIVVWLALFISIAGIGMVSPLLPVFAQDMGASGIWLGLAFSGFAFSQVPLMPVAGRLSDRFGKKLFIWLGLLIYAIAAVGYVWSPGYQELVFFRVFSGVGAAMVIPIAFAYIGELAPRGQEGRYMGLFTIAFLAGFGIGPVLGGTVHDSFGMDAAFASMGVLATAGLLIVLLFLPASRPSSRAMQSNKPASSFRSMLRDETMRGLITFQLVFGLSYGSVLAFLGIFMTTVMGASVAHVGIVLSARSIQNGMLSYPFGWLADRVSRVVLVNIGMIAMSTGIFFIPWTRDFAMLLGLFMVMATFESVALPAAEAITVEKGRSLGMGSVMGVFNMAMSLGMIVGSVIGGLIQGSIGIGWVFRFAAVLGLVGVVVFNVFMRRAGAGLGLAGGIDSQRAGSLT